jgi:hypothetical protein
MLGLLLVSAAMVGCASNERVASSGANELDYEDGLERARRSIAQAEQAGAAEYGDPQLALAREKLRAAEAAMEDGAIEQAHRLVVEADLDADLASAINRNQQTQALANEVRSGLDTLEDELGRGSSEPERR